MTSDRLYHHVLVEVPDGLLDGDLRITGNLWVGHIATARKPMNALNCGAQYSKTIQGTDGHTATSHGVAKHAQRGTITTGTQSSIDASGRAPLTVDGDAIRTKGLCLQNGQQVSARLDRGGIIASGQKQDGACDGFTQRFLRPLFVHFPRILQAWMDAYDATKLGHGRCTESRPGIHKPSSLRSRINPSRVPVHEQKDSGNERCARTMYPSRS
jgi:hypothetical protein